MPTPTIQELLNEPGMKSEIVRSIESAMLIIVLFLKNEPEQLEKTVEHYENLYLLRKAIETHQPEHLNT
jgi:hypothetical protein